MKNKKEYKAISYKKLAGFLLMCGCRLVDVKREESNKFVFYFKDSKKTNHDIQAYFGNARTTNVDEEE